MRRLFNKLTGADNKEQEMKDLKEAKQLTKVSDSYNAFISAAGDTLSLAQEVTVSLKDRIDDYTNQIEATSLVIPDALILVNSNGQIENVNQAAEDIFGMAKSTLMTKQLSDLFISVDGGEISIPKFKHIYGKTKNVFEVVRRGNIEIHGRKANGIQFYPNIKVSEFVHSDKATRYMLLVQDITENVLAEQRFVKVFDRQNATIKALPDILLTLNSNLKIVDIQNPTNHISFLHSDDNGSNLADVVEPQVFDQFRVACEKVALTNGVEAWNFEVIIDHFVTYYEARASKSGNEILVIVRDESDVIIARDELLESEEHFRMFGQASSEAMMIHDANSILDWNPRLSEMTGFSYAEIQQMKADEFIHPMERANISSASIGSSAAYSTLFRTKSGDIVEVAINERQIEWKNEPASIKVIRDVTHLKDVEQLLFLSRQRYQTITDNTFDVVCCYGRDLVLTFVNQTFMDYFNKPLLADTILLEAIDARDHHRVRNHLSEITASNPIKRTVHRVAFNGSTRWLDWIDRAVFDDSGKFVEYQGIGRDVTDYIKNYKNQE